MNVPMARTLSRFLPVAVAIAIMAGCGSDAAHYISSAKTYIAKPDTIIIFNVPPSFEIWMRRLQGRGELPESEIRRRMETALAEYEAALTHDYYRFLINGDVASTVATVDAMARLDAHDQTKEFEARELVKVLHQQTADYLRQNS